MEKAPVPYPPVMHSLASASTIAWLIHQKFELGIPLYRQEKEWEALGLSLSRYFRFLYVGLLQYQGCRKSHPVFRVPAGKCFS